jgi:hypothetical protein
MSSERAGWNGGRLMTCGKCNLIMDRDIITVLNLQMQGAGFPQRALNELIEREEISGDKNYASPLNSEPIITLNARARRAPSGVKG